MRRIEKFFKVVKVVLWLLPVFLFVWILNQNFVPGGKFEVKYDVTKDSKLLRNFASKEKDKLIGTKNRPGDNGYFQLITTTPVYFDVTVPRPFPKATIYLKYQNPDGQPEIKLGAEQVNGAYYYQDMAHFNPIVDDLLNSGSGQWYTIQEGDLILWQRDGRRYETIDDLLQNLPETEKILQYNYKLASPSELPGYKKSSQLQEINKSLRGKHEIYTYLAQGENLDFTFTIQDINRNSGEDDFKVVVYSNVGEKIKEESLPDDGEDKASGQVLPERTKQILIHEIPPGVYRLSIDTSDDIFIKKIVTKQNLLMFQGNIYLTDNDEYKDILGDKKIESTAFYTTSSTLKIRTAHEKGLQILTVGQESLEIDEKHSFKEIEELGGVTRIVTPQNDVYIEGDGFFAFKADQLFDPNFNLVPGVADADNIEEYEFIIAKYKQAKKIDDYFLAEATVEVPHLYFKNNEKITTSFIFSLPGLPENKRLFKIKEVTILFEKEPLTINNFIPRLKNWLNHNIISKE